MSRADMGFFPWRATRVGLPSIAQVRYTSAPVSKRPSPPATKQDIEDFGNLIGGYCIRAEQKIDDLKTHMEQWKEDLRNQVQFLHQELCRDLARANREEVQMLKERLQNLELRLAARLP